MNAIGLVPAAEISGVAYRKTTHRNRLSQQLIGRSEGSIEFKHQNISAVLIELGFPYISGYKPRSNYQELLFEVVSDRLSANRHLIEVAEADVDLPIVVPEVDDILSALTSAPSIVINFECARLIKCGRISQ